MYTGVKRCSCGSLVPSPIEEADWPESEAVANFRKKKDELEVFMERITEIAHEREDVQKKTQTKWINSMLSKGSHPLVKDLFNDLRDGTRLLALLEVLTNNEYKREKGKMRVHHLNNVSRALQILKDNNVRLVNISNNDIVDGNGKITLALSWSIFLHWQVNDIMKNLMATTHQTNLEKALLSWCQTNTKPYPGVEIKNFSTSWSDGLAFGALLHRWRPDILDFASLASKQDPSERLDIVFKVAHDVLGIERLLDPEDVNTAIPDKKSVMMYVMCLFQSLAQSGLEPPPLPSTEELEEEIKIEVAKLEAELHKPPSEELTSYQNIVEQVLSWLLIADDRISSMDPISDELNEVKKQFQEHEKFMLSLTEHQGDVGEVLQEGSKILTEAKLVPLEIEEVRVQMKLLNTKWEDLRVKAMDRQNKIHEKLMTLQLAELEALKEFLTATEDRISHMGAPPLEDISALEESCIAQQQLHEDILKQQERVVAFSNLVVVVDENNHQDNEFANMEDQLAALSERWTHICSWTEKRGSILQKLKVHVPTYLKEQKFLEEWLQQQEKKLKEVEANPSDTSEDSLMERYEKMQVLQAEMEEKMKGITSLQNSVQTLIDESSGSTFKGPGDENGEGSEFSGSKFLDKLESLQDRWEALSQIMEAQSQRITMYGVKPVEKSPVIGIGIPEKVSITPMGVEIVDILALSKQDFPKAKRTKIMNEFETSYGRVSEWVMRTESLIEVIPGSSATTFDELSVDEQLILWEDLELELHTNEPLFQDALKDSQALIQHMSQENQETQEVEEQVNVLKEKWEKVREVLNKRKLLIDYLLAKKQLQAEITTMSNILTAYEKWLESQVEVSPISNQPRKLLEQCRVKKKTMTSHEGRLAKLKTKAMEVLNMDDGKEDAELKAEFSQFSTRWTQTVERLNLRLTQLEGINRMSAEEKYSESSHLIGQWLKGTEAIVAEEPKYHDIQAMKVHQRKLAEVLQESKSHEENLEVIIAKSGNGGEHVGALEQLKGRFVETKAVLEERNATLTSMILKMDKWQAEMSGLEGWLEEVDVFVCAETMAVGDADFLEAQLEQSTALQHDIEALTATYTLLTGTGKDLTHDLEGNMQHSVKARLFKLTSHWTETVRKAGEQNVLLKDAYEKTKEVLRGIDETCEWLNQLNRDSPKIATISNPSDLARLTRKYQALKDRVDKREESFRNLNEKGNELLLLHQKDQFKDDERSGNTLQDLAKTFTTLNSRWTEITGMVDKNCQMLKDASFLYGEFRSLTAQQMDWLDRLERKLKKPITSAADMEELSEDLDDIEQYVGDEQEAKLSKLQEIGRKLVHDKILVGSIQSDVQQVTNRWTHLNQQAESRKTELENELMDAEGWESVVQQLFDGLEIADKNLTARLEHDLSVEDFPVEMEQLAEELKQQDKLLKDMLFQVEVYRKAGKLEAASRLEEQKNMLEDRFKEVQSKFSQFSCPPPESRIYGRIERIWRSLRQVEQALCFLELASDDPESILGQLNHCTKEYANLSALKREVEVVLKEGRRQVEDKKAEGKLTTELDSIKALYNKLGMQIASIRNSLEKGLALSTEMAEGLGSLEVWLEQTETESKGTYLDKESELDFLRGRTEELPRWTKILESFNANYENFLKLVDPVLLDGLKERRTLVLDRWDLISHDIVRRHEQGLKGTSIPDLEVQIEKDKTDLEEWLNRAENFLSRINTEGALFTDEELVQLHELNDNLNDKSDSLDFLKDKVVDLIVSKGDPYSFENDENLMLEKLAHRLESIGIQFQNLSSCFLDDMCDDSTALDSLSSAFKVPNNAINGPPPKSRKLDFPPSGICNLGFDDFDDEEEPLSGRKKPLVAQVSTDVELPLPRSPTEKRRAYSVQTVPEVKVTISRVKAQRLSSVESVEGDSDMNQVSVIAKSEGQGQGDSDTENMDLDTDEELGPLSECVAVPVEPEPDSGDRELEPLEKPPVSGIRKSSGGGCGGGTLEGLGSKRAAVEANGRSAGSRTLRGASASAQSFKKEVIAQPSRNEGIAQSLRKEGIAPYSKKEAIVQSVKNENQTSKKEGKVKIVEIKSNDIVQGILRMEPQLGKRDKMAIVKCPLTSIASKSKHSLETGQKGSKNLRTELVEDFYSADEDPYGFSNLSAPVSKTGSGDGHKKCDDISAFEKEGQEISRTMSRMARKLEEIEKDADPRKRVDALEIELIAVEPEVALTISKGDSLIFKISKVDLQKAKQIRGALDLLRADWLQLKSRAERQRLAALKLETTQLECESAIQDLEQWISNVILSPQNEKKKHLTSLGKKEEEMKTLRKRIEELNKRNIRGFSPEFSNLEKEWSKAEKILKGVDERQPVKGISAREKSKIPIPQVKVSPLSSKTEEVKVSSKTEEVKSLPKTEETVVVERVSKQFSSSPLKPKSAHVQLSPSPTWSPELVTRVNRLREQVATVTRSLASSDDPITVKAELEKLSPRVLEIEELEESGIKGSPDQVLQAKRVIQKLLDEWATLNLTERQMSIRCASKSPSPSPFAMRSPDSSDIEDLETWLDEMDGLMNELKTNPDSDQSRTDSQNKLKDMETRISKRHRSVMLLMSKTSRMSPAYDESSRKMDKIGYRWRNLLAEMTIRRDRICGTSGMHRTLSKWWEPQVVLSDWIERANSAVESPVLLSDETAMRNALSNLKSLEHEIGSKRPDLEKLRSKKHLVSEDELGRFERDIERLSLALPSQRKYVEERLAKLKKVTSQLDTTTSWVLEVRAQVATAKHRLPEERIAAIHSIKVRVGEKASEVLDVLCNYANLEHECEEKGQGMRPLMTEKIRQLKEDWIYVQSGGEINILTPAGEDKFCNWREHKLRTENAEPEKAEVRIRPRSEEIPKEAVVLLGQSAGDCEEEVVEASKQIQHNEESMTLTLKALKQQIVIIGNVEDVRNVLEKQKNVLRELELKKPQLDELMQTAESLKSESNRHNLHVKVTKLREHWGETNCAVVGRKKELEDCLADSSRWESQLKGIDEWFQSVESKLTHLNLSRSGSQGNEMGEQKKLEMEVHQLEQELEGFNDFTHHLVATYYQDDPSRLKRTQEQLSQRYNYITNTLMARTCSSHRLGFQSCPAPLTPTPEERAIEAQLSWLSEAEMAVGRLEMDLQRLGSTFSRDSSMARTTLQKLKELQTELESHANTVAALGSTARASAAGMDRPEDAQVLLRRLDEMNQRWHGLKQRSMAIRNRLESNTEHWHALLLSLREIIEWVIRKDTELTSLGPPGGDVFSLQKQMDDHRAFRRELDGKRPVVETNLISGRQHVANEPPVSDASDNEASRELEGDARGYRSAEVAARELTRSIRREVTKLSETWLTLLARSDNRQIRLEDTIQRLRSFQQMLDDGSARLATAEAIKSRWPTIAAVGDKSTLLDQLKTFREHISSTQRAVNEINEEAGMMTGNNIMLSNANVLRLDDLNHRLRNLQLNVEERENELSSIGGAPPVASVIAVIPPSSNASVNPPWERSLTPAKVPYYINHQTETTQWDHPLMTSILDSLSTYNDVRFSAYRTALKLRALQKEIRLDTLPLKTVIGTFDSLGLRGHNDRILDVPDMVSTLNSLYNTCGPSTGTMGSVKGTAASQSQTLNIPLLTDLAINWILNVFDSQRLGQIRNLSFKIAVVLLCKGPMEDKFRYLFRLVADTNKQVDQRKLGLLLHDCMQIPRQLGEVAAFGGSNIEPSVRSCFDKAPKDKSMIEVTHFLEWVRQEPQSIVWLPVLHRIAAAEGAKHEAVKCNVCKQSPILGLRYRCLKCFNVDMCQRCFFSGKKAKNHKLTHPMQEYCTESTASEDVRDFTRALKNRFKSKRSLQKHRKLGYLPVQTVLEGDTLESPSPAPSPQHSLSPDIHSRVDTYATRLADVEIRNRYNSTPDSEDEHSLIAQYCQSLTRGDSVIPRSPIQIVASIDAEQSEQLEAVIRALEEENASLQAEYDRLKHKSQANGQSFNSTPSDEQNLDPPDLHPPQNGSGRSYYGQMDSNENNILAEARLLRQHKGRLEARMQILEEHNRQLEMQLQRLRQLLDEPKPNSPSKTGTLQSKSVVAAELAMDSPLPQRANGHFNNVTVDSWHPDARYSEESRPPPPTPGYAGTSNDSTQLQRPGDHQLQHN